MCKIARNQHAKSAPFHNQRQISSVANCNLQSLNFSSAEPKGCRRISPIELRSGVTCNLACGRVRAFLWQNHQLLRPSSVTICNLDRLGPLRLVQVTSGGMKNTMARYRELMNKSKITRHTKHHHRTVISDMIIRLAKPKWQVGALIEIICIIHLEVGASGMSSFICTGGRE